VSIVRIIADCSSRCVIDSSKLSGSSGACTVRTSLLVRTCIAFRITCPGPPRARARLPVVFAPDDPDEGLEALGGGRTWWAHIEFTRINIEPIILKK
jgi:hypothetical protein